MPLIRYQEFRFKPATRRIIEQANEIIARYAAQGFELTLRQLYYQFVSRDLFPEEWADPRTGSTNNVRSYKKLGSVVNDARLAGLIDWDHISDRTRNLQQQAAWDGPQDIVAACAQQFRSHLWATQPYYCEVWIEKDALAGVIEEVCNSLRVPYFSCRGYTSQSEMWAAGRRLRAKRQAGKKLRIFHLGDHDPSGIDMTRDITDRLEVFAGAAVQIDRLALSMAQVRQYNAPPNPAKDTDSRAAWYKEEYGDESWELDALEPPVIVDLVRRAVGRLIDGAAWSEAARREREARAHLTAIAEQWDRITPGLEIAEVGDEGEDAPPAGDEEDP